MQSITSTVGFPRSTKRKWWANCKRLGKMWCVDKSEKESLRLSMCHLLTLDLMK